MGVHDAPQWLLPAFVRSVVHVGATAPPDRVAEVGAELLRRWSGPERVFHDVRHLVHVLSRVDELAEETHEPDVVRLAAWYHGAIFGTAEAATYAERGGEDEVASARLALDELTDLGVPADRAQRVYDLVVALRRHTPNPDDFDCAVLCDADLAILAAEPQRYRSYVAEIREEYRHVPVGDFLRARGRILRKLLDRRAIFLSPLGAAWEEAARQNVDAELQRITKQLAAVEAETPPPDAPDA